MADKRLEGANFSNADLYGADLRDLCNLDKAIGLESSKYLDRTTIYATNPVHIEILKKWKEIHNTNI